MEAVVLRYGKYDSTLKKPGIHFSNIFGRQVINISTRVQTAEIKRSTVIDKEGNPLIVAAVVVYQCVEQQRVATPRARGAVVAPRFPLPLPAEARHALFCFVLF